MKHLNNYREFNEKFNWEQYGDKREFVEVLRGCIKEVGSLKKDIEKLYSIGQNQFYGVWVGQQMDKKGFDRNLSNAILSEIDGLKGRIGPNMAGEFVNVKRNFFQRLMGKSGIGVQGDTSIIGNLMRLVDEDVRKELEDERWKKMVSQLWKDLNESAEIGYDEEGNFLGFNDPRYRKAVEDNEKKRLQFADRMGDYLEKVKDLKSKVENLKSSVLEKLSNADHKVDPSKLKLVSDGFDKMLNKIGPDKEEIVKKRFIDKFRKEEEKTTKDYSILTLGDKFINKEKVKYFW